MKKIVLIALLVVLFLGFLTQVIPFAQIPTTPPASDSTSCIQDSSLGVQGATPSTFPLCHVECIIVNGLPICYVVCLEPVEGPIGPPVDEHQEIDGP